MEKDVQCDFDKVLAEDSDKVLDRNLEMELDRDLDADIPFGFRQLVNLKP